MKTKIFLFAWLFAVTLVHGQTYEQTTFVLNEAVPANNEVVYEASTSIKLLDGFSCNPSKNKSVRLFINRFGVFPPDEGFLGGPPTSDHDGVVGALPGELNISDFGGAVYSIPIFMPNGIGAMTPHIAVTYNNQTGNGLLGWGWNLSGLSSIVRVGQTLYHDNNQTAVNFADDRFVVDGKRLLLCSGNYGGNGSVYKTEIDEMSKIVSYSEGHIGPSRFVIYKKDGSVWEYGGTNDSRIEPQNQNNVVLTWLVNKISDPDGNSIVFNYIENQSNGEWYINNIEYTLNPNAGINNMYKVDFVYDDRSDVELGYEYGSIVRKAKILKNILIINMMTGSTLYDYSFKYIEPGSFDESQQFMYYRLQSIGLSANGMKLNPTVISWNSKQKHYPDKFEKYSLTQDVFNKVPFVGDFNGDGYSDVALVPYKTGSAYLDDVLVEIHLNNGDGTFDDEPFFTTTLNKTLEWLYVVDLDGDGLDDLVPFFVNDENTGWKSKVYAYINRGDTFQLMGEKSSNRYFTLYPGDFCNEKKTCFFVEYYIAANGNTENPAIIYYDNNTLESQSLGTQSLIAAAERVCVADIDSDGCSEIIVLKNNNSIVVKITKENCQYIFNNLYTDNNFNDDDFLFPGDFNGDGHVDVLKYDNVTYWKVAFSDGNRLTTPVSCLGNNLLNGLTLAPQDYYYCSLQNLSMPSETIRTADFDGDGKTDVAVFKNTGGNYYVTMGFKMYKKPDGSYGFSDIRRYYLSINNSHQYVHVGNFLGRENESILGSVRSTPYPNEIPKIVSLNPQSALYSVERITDGLGNAHGFKYEYLMPNKLESFYNYDYQLVNNDLRTVSVPIRALCSDTVFSSNNNPCVTTYSYTNMLYNNKGHGYLGFMNEESKFFINNVLQKIESVEKNMEMADEYDVLLPKSYVKYNNNQISDLVQYLYSIYICDYNNKISMPLLTCKNIVEYDVDKSGAILKTKVENIDYQSDMSPGYYADIVNIAQSVCGQDASYTGHDAQSCSYWDKTEYIYNNVVANWVVSRKHRITKKQHYLDNETVGSCEIFEYSNNNPYQVTRRRLLPNIDMNYNDPLTIVAEYSYDAVGHAVMQSLTTPSSKNQRVTRVNYGGEYNFRLPTITINENGWEIHNTYDSNYGMLNSTLDYNNFETESNSDPFEITVENRLPGGVTNIKTKRWATGNENAPANAVFYCWEKTTGKAETYTFYNKNGKKLREVSFSLYSEPIYVDFTYDDNGNLISQSNPFKNGDDVQWNYYVYDDINRLREEFFPNGLKKTYTYSQLQNTIYSTSPEGVSHTVIETLNPMGWCTQEIDMGGNTIDYDYYSDGKLKSVMIGGNAATKVEYEYDNLRNISKMKDPACGMVLYEYNAFGELVRITNPKQCVTTYDYDLLGNVVSRCETDAKGMNSVVTQWVYDTQKGQIGMLSQIVYGKSHSVTYDYDDMLRVTGVHEIVNGTSYSTNYTYDIANREESISYPTGLTVLKKYSNSGLYKSMVNAFDNKVLWQTESADAMGYITDYQMGNGLKTHRKYDARSNLLTGIYTVSDNKVYQDLDYTYDAFGNLMSRTKLNGIKKTESFVYDEFNRLSEIRMNGLVSGVMEYDNLGNIISKYAENKDVFYDAQYQTNNPYAIKRAKSDFDALLSENQSVEYTPFDKMSYVLCENNSLSIDYGFDHERIHSEEIIDGIKKDKVYIGDCEYVSKDGKTIAYTYLKGPMGVFAVCRTDDNGTNSIVYIHKDHLNSWCLITDEKGGILQNVSFDAWGNPRDGDNWFGQYDGDLLCDRGFTGHEHLPAFGIINMNGRAYDPIMSMMMSPDSFIQNIDFSQNFNRYSYCYNNPLSYCDPSGEWVEWLLYGVFNGAMNVLYNIESIDGFNEGALVFGAGFVSGCLTKGLAECSWTLQIVGNVAGKTLETSISSFVEKNEGKNLNWSIFEDKNFQSDMLYSLGSCLASSVLNTYIVNPTDSDDGVTLASKLCHNRVDQMVLETSTKKIVGNLFAGKKIFDGLNCRNWSEFKPYARCVAGMLFDGLEFEGRSSTLSSVFGKLFNINVSGELSSVANGINSCYSGFRSLFLKN